MTLPRLAEVDRILHGESLEDSGISPVLLCLTLTNELLIR